MPMKAAVLERVKKLVVKDVPLPKIGSDEILVKVKACGLCATDIKLYEGKYTAKTPIILGHEFSGEIVKVGEKAKNFKTGDRVIIDPNESCGVCPWCRQAKPTFCTNLTEYGVLRDGGFAEYVACGEKGAYKIPENLDFIKASLTEAVSCALHAVDQADVEIEENVVIIGGGIQGQLILQLLKKTGAKRIVMVTRSTSKLKIAQKFGATDLIKADENNIQKKVFSITEEGADIVIEAVGTLETVEEAISLTRRGGKVIIFGVSTEGEKAKISPFEILYKELTIKGAWINPYTFTRAISILANSTIEVNSLISEKISLIEIDRGFSLMKEKPEGFMKAVIIP